MNLGIILFVTGFLIAMTPSNLVLSFVWGSQMRLQFILTFIGAIIISIGFWIMHTGKGD